MGISNVGAIPYRRLTDPLALPYGTTSQRTTVPPGFIPAEANTFRVTNRGNSWVRLKGARGAGASTLTIQDGEGWLFPPGFSGTFTSQFPEAMATIAVGPNAAAGILEVTYGVGSSGESVASLVAAGGSPSSVTVANTPLPVSQSGSWSLSVAGSLPAGNNALGSVTVSNFPATQPISGSVTVGNFPASQPVTGTFWQATQPVSGTVTVGNLPATQQVADANGSLTVDTGTPGTFAATPSSLAAHAIVPTRNTNASTLVLKAGAGNLYSAYSVAGNTGYILMALDRTAAPAAGAVIVPAEIISMAQVPANGYGSISPPDIPDRFVNGCVLIATTSLTTFSAPQNLPFFNRGKVA